MVTLESIELLTQRLYEINKLIKEGNKFYGFSSKPLEEIADTFDLEHKASLIFPDENGIYIQEYYTDKDGNIFSFNFKVDKLNEKLLAIEYLPIIDIFDGDGWENLDITPLLEKYVAEDEKKVELLRKVRKRIDEVLHPSYII